MRLDKAEQAETEHLAPVVAGPARVRRIGPELVDRHLLDGDAGGRRGLEAACPGRQSREPVALALHRRANRVMDVRRDARWASMSEGATDMADATTTTRRCIGSARFGIEGHEAPIEDFPRQPSQRDGLARMCKTHWNAYTAGLARDAKARKAASAADPAIEPGEPTPGPNEPTVSDAANTADADRATAEQPTSKRKRSRTAAGPAAGSQGDEG